MAAAAGSRSGKSRTEPGVDQVSVLRYHSIRADWHHHHRDVGVDGVRVMAILTRLAVL